MHLDTTMAFTDFFEEMAPFPRDLLPRLRDLGDKVLLGSDFPNIPYPYAHQLEVAGAPRPGRRLAARGLLGQRGGPVRGSGTGIGRVHPSVGPLDCQGSTD